VSHGGATVGVSTLLTLLPDHGVAIVQLANSDYKHLGNQVILNDIIEAIPTIPANREAPSFAPPHLEPIMSSTIKLIPRAASITERQNDIGHFAGTYSDTGYGDYVFCHPPNEKYGTHFSDRGCRQVHSDYATVEDVVSLSTTKLYGYMKRPLATAKYLTLTLLTRNNDIDFLSSQDENAVTFELHYTRVFPKGFGTDERPFEYGGSPGSGPRAVFSLTEGDIRGFGMFGFAGQVLIREKLGRNIQERAEVWFDKVST
jgi:hypothetical protein